MARNNCLKFQLVAVLVIAMVACKHPRPTSGIRIVYAIDLDLAIDDKIREVRRDLVRNLSDNIIPAMVTVATTPRGRLVVVPGLGVSPTTIDDRIKTDYGHELKVGDCGGSAPPTARCVDLPPAYITDLEAVALKGALEAIRNRIDKAPIVDPSVIARDGHIIVELPGDPDGPALAEMRTLIPRRANLEMKVADDCSDPPGTGCGASGEHGGSPYMKRLFAHVGSDHDGKPSDPDAQAAGIAADVDQWHPEDGGGTHTDYYLRAPDIERNGSVVTGRAVIEAYLRDLVARDPAFRIRDDHELGFEHVVPAADARQPRPYWRTYYLECAARVTGAMIASASGTSDPNTNRPLVLLEFGREGGRLFGDVTSQIVGMKLVTMLDGTVKSAPIINGAIRGGRASIAMGGTDPTRLERERDELVEVLQTGSLPAPIQELSVSKFGP